MHDHTLWIEVDLGAIRKNLDTVKSLAGGSVSVMAIVKANAYGHGMLPVAHALSEKIHYFGVSSFREARELREDGLLTPILILSSVLPEEIGPAIDKDITFTISDVGYIDEVNRIATAQKKQAKVHVKVDTGMGRWGLPYTEAYEIIRMIKKEYPALVCEGIFTHFTVADNYEFDYTDRQIELFKALLDELEKVGVTFDYVHAANSAGILNFSESHFNMIRPGIMMYGYCPRKSLREKIELNEALSLKAHISLIKTLAAQRSASYGRSFIADKKTKIGVIPIGYSHGYPYSLSGKARVLIADNEYPVAGNICMDYCMVELGYETTVQVGDEVVLIGSRDGAKITAYDLAEIARTIPYEILTNLNPAIPRVYIE